jgi:hypothetical protein
VVEIERQVVVLGALAATIDTVQAHRTEMYGIKKKLVASIATEHKHKRTIFA